MNMVSGERITCDLAIIGSGSAAFATAIRAVGFGAKVVMIEQSTIGGTCVNVGCVPSKALLAAAEARYRALHRWFPGISTWADPVAMDSLIAGKDELVSALRKDKYEDLATAYGVTLIHGHARFVPGGQLIVEGTKQGAPFREVVATTMVIATGATATVPPIQGIETVNYLTSTTAMELSHVPERLVVIGGNAVGLEQAQLFAHLGANVTILEARERIAPFEEPEISDALATVFASEGIGLVASANIERVSTSGSTIRLAFTHTTGTTHLDCDALLVATGRRPNADGLGLEHVGVQIGQQGEVVVDGHLQTANPKIFAAGDVTGAPQFVYVAGYHGTMVAENALNDAQRSVDYRTLPRVTFTTPQIASVGLTDEEAMRAGYSCDCRVLPLSAVPRALVNRNTGGLAKIVADRGTGRVLGIHLLAEGASDAILAGVYALEANFTVDQLATIWAPYLTMAEAIRLGAQSFTRDVSKLSCCAS